MMDAVHAYNRERGRRMVVWKKGSGGSYVKLVCESAVKIVDGKQQLVPGSCPAFVNLKARSHNTWGISGHRFDHVNCTSMPSIGAGALANLSNFRDALGVSKGRATANLLVENICKNNGLKVNV